jgi:MFS family permease
MANTAIDTPAANSSLATENQRDGVKVEKPTGFRFWLIIFGLCLALLCIALVRVGSSMAFRGKGSPIRCQDRTIVATAVPQITTDFNSLEDASWYGSAYLFGTCAFQLLFGKLYARVSMKWMFIFSLFIFEVGSVICGAAPNSVALILGRAIAGIGCAGVTAGALIVTFHHSKSSKTSDGAWCGLTRRMLDCRRVC